MKTFKQHYVIQEADATPFLKFYAAFRRQNTPESYIIDECLLILEDYYDDYIKWYDKYGIKDNVQLSIYIDFRKQLNKIRSALRSKDEGEKIEAVDSAINQWHHDYPVVMHMVMQAGDDETSEEEIDRQKEKWYKVMDILTSLGRLPPDSPYAQKT